MRISLLMLSWQAFCNAARETAEGIAGNVECDAVSEDCGCEGNVGDCYPNLVDFLEDFTNYYAYSEIYFLLQDGGKFVDEQIYF